MFPESNVSTESEDFGSFLDEDLSLLQGYFSQILLQEKNDFPLCISDAVSTEIDSDSALNSSTVSPCSKSFSDDEEDEIDFHIWRKKPVEQWNKIDTTNWLLSAAHETKHAFARMSPELAMPGKELCLLSLQDFVNFDQNFGEKLFHLLQERIKAQYSPSGSEYSSSDDEASIGNDNVLSDGDYDSDLGRIKKRVGRPSTKKPKEPRQKLWEFIRDALLNPEYCPKYICWENYEEKTFRFVESAQMARLWGERASKKNKTKKMTYENFSRAMRYYYKPKIFVAVPGRRLVYRFGENATGLETNCPNFDPNYYRHVKKSEF